MCVCVCVCVCVCARVRACVCLCVEKERERLVTMLKRETPEADREADKQTDRDGRTERQTHSYRTANAQSPMEVDQSKTMTVIESRVNDSFTFPLTRPRHWRFEIDTQSGTCRKQHCRTFQCMVSSQCNYVLVEERARVCRGCHWPSKTVGAHRP